MTKLFYFAIGNDTIFLYLFMLLKKIYLIYKVKVNETKTNKQKRTKSKNENQIKRTTRK